MSTDAEGQPAAPPATPAPAAAPPGDQDRGTDEVAAAGAVDATNAVGAIANNAQVQGAGRLVVPHPAAPRGFIDRRARRESEAFNKGTLDNEAYRNNHDRLENLRWHVALAAKIVFWVVIALLIVGMVLWSMHVFLPATCHWLSASQIDLIQRVLITVAVSGLVGGFAQRVMAPPPSPNGDGNGR